MMSFIVWRQVHVRNWWETCFMCSLLQSLQCMPCKLYTNAITTPDHSPDTAILTLSVQTCFEYAETGMRPPWVQGHLSRPQQPRFSCHHTSLECMSKVNTHLEPLPDLEYTSRCLFLRIYCDNPRCGPTHHKQAPCRQIVARLRIQASMKRARRIAASAAISCGVATRLSWSRSSLSPCCSEISLKVCQSGQRWTLAGGKQGWRVYAALHCFTTSMSCVAQNVTLTQFRYLISPCIMKSSKSCPNITSDVE